MRKVIAFASISLIIIVIAYYVYNSKVKDNVNNYDAQRTATNQSQENQVSQESTQNQSQGQQQPATAEAPKEPPAPVETEELSNFSTKIYTKESNRQNNVSITCSALNDTDVANGEEFSFCNTVGRSSPSKGYKKADIFTNGEKTKGYGGGNCQVSTTLYNAVLEVPNLDVTERHEHSNKVPYIKSGKDAAVAYGSYDFKFINNTGSTIRIKAENSADLVSIRLIKLV